MTDFYCTKENVLWILGHTRFYEECMAFGQLKYAAKQLSDYVRTLNPGCRWCAAHKAVAFQTKLLDAFAKIFFWLYDRGRLDDIRLVLDFVVKHKSEPFDRIVMAYSGPSTELKDRIATVEQKVPNAV